MSRIAALAALLAVALTGCAAHEAALAPPTGGDISRVRIATIDVLMQQGVELLDVPVCEPVDGDIRCKGTTADGTAIESVAADGDVSKVKITVGGKVVFDDSLSKVIEDAGRAK